MSNFFNYQESQDQFIFIKNQFIHQEYRQILTWVFTYLIISDAYFQIHESLEMLNTLLI